MRRTFFLPALIQVVVALAELALLLRILFRLFAANPNASFVNWIYGTSSTLLAPFRGIFPSAVIARSYVLDFTALFALIIYALIGSLLIYLAALLEGAVTHAAQPARPTTKGGRRAV